MKERPKEIMTITLIGINILVFIVLTMIGRTEDGYFMLQHGAMYEPYIIENQEYYRLFTSLFLHFGISHLLNNMVLLWALGSIFEKEAGKIRFLLCYFISGMVVICCLCTGIPCTTDRLYLPGHREQFSD